MIKFFDVILAKGKIQRDRTVARITLKSITSCRALLCAAPGKTDFGIVLDKKT